MHYLTDFYRRRKAKIVDCMGGKCYICGYCRHISALEMHHINPEEKEFTFSQTSRYKNWKKLEEEMKKCVLLCANCHREIHTGEFQCKLESSFSQEVYDNLSTIEEKVAKVCVDCGVEITDRATRCERCSQLHCRVVERPDRDTLKELIRIHSFKFIGDLYGISDNGVRKWCIGEKLPSTKKEIKKISNEDWRTI